MTKLSHTQAYARFFEEMTPETVGSVKQFLADDVVFTDPFNKLHGPDAFVAERLQAFKENGVTSLNVSFLGTTSKERIENFDKLNNLIAKAL